MANYVQEEKDRFSYLYSSEMDIPFRIKIGTLEGQRQKKSVKELLAVPQLQFSGLYQSDYSDVYVVAEIYTNGKRLTLPSQTAYKPFSNRWNWNEWVILPIHFKDIPRNAKLAFTIFDIYGPQKAVPVGGTTISIFGKHGCLRRGIHDLRVWPDIEVDGSLKNSTPGEIEDNAEMQSEMNRLSKLLQKHRKGRMMTVDWLDRLTFREIEVINEQEKRRSNHMFLTVKFPKFHYDGFEHSVVYFEYTTELLTSAFTEPKVRRYAISRLRCADNEELLLYLLQLVQALRYEDPEFMNEQTADEPPALSEEATFSEATKSRLERELAEAFLESELGESQSLTQSEELPSDSDSEHGDDLFSPIPPNASIEASLTVSAPSSLETSVFQCADNEELLLYLL